MNRRGVGPGSQALLAGTGDDLAGRIVAVGAEGDILGFAVRPQQQPELRRTIGELHAINIVTAGTDAAEEDRLHRAERLEHRLQL